MKRNLISFMILVFLLSGTLPAQEEARLLRFPAVFDKQVVFTHAGDLYTVSAEGGVARKLTNHSGFEMFARFSPDGGTLAFTGQYDGNTEVYMMPAEGGIPTRLTYTANLDRDDVSDRMGPNNIVMGWKHDNKHIVFRSRMTEHNDFNGQLYLTSTDGDLHSQLPLPRGGFCSYSGDDSKLAYNRVFREFRTWKRYRGGMADDIWVHDFTSGKTENITRNGAQDIIPMWKDDNIYFLSDRDDLKKMNLYVYHTGSQKTRKLTDFTEFDIKFPSLGKSKIAFENGGYIYLFDTGSEKITRLKIYINEDRLGSRGGLKKVKGNITNFEISPDGQRALFGARGEVFTVPKKFGNTLNLTKSPGVHERNSKWSPDGKWIAYISDATGENEIYIQSASGDREPVQVTTGGGSYMYQIFWSPDSQKLMWGDRKQRLRYVDIGKKEIKDIHVSGIWEIRNYSWSPDSKWVAYSRNTREQMTRIFLYSLEQDRNFPVTDLWYDAFAPVFCPEGKYLYFISNRDFNPIYSRTEWNHAYRDMSRIYLVTLAKGTPSPFEPKSDEVAVSGKSASGKPAREKKKDRKGDQNETTVSVKIDIDGLGNRIIDLPIVPSAYFNLAAVKGKIYYQRRGMADKKTILFVYDLKDQKETRLGEFGGYEISADAKKMLVSRDGSYAIIDLPGSPIKLSEFLNLENMEMVHCKKCEWKQIFHESWRQMRDFFYIPNMHGVDWQKMRDRYAPLLKHVNHRNDLTYIIGEMIGELNIGHSYVGGGERPRVTEVQQGLLGARLEKDKKSGYFRIQKILKGENWVSTRVSPLTAVGVNAREGDYIIEVNGQSTAEMNNIYKALTNTAGRQVTLTLNSSATPRGSRKVVVVPVRSELDLYYYNMVQANIEKVSRATGGKVGYIHIPDMGVQGLNEFVKYYYPQLTKKALIIDVRGNGGGNVSPMVIERLRRRISMITIARNGTPSVNPGGMMWGPLVCLCDEFSASDGDIFPYRFKVQKLGKLIGKRTWGGVVGIRGPLPLLDGGQLFKPEFSRYDVAGKEWIMEGVGVEPDIVVDNDPAKEFAGIDQQLNKAVEVILEELKTKEKEIPPAPPYPDKSEGKKE